MPCAGCQLSIVYAPVTGNPLQVSVMFVIDQGQDPHGKCGGPECKQTAPCFPIGTVTVTDLQMVPSSLRVHHRTFVGDTWADYTLSGVGEGMLFRVPGISIQCGEALVCAEVFDDDQDPPVLLGRVELRCSACSS